MDHLSPALRRELENAIFDARTHAHAGAMSALRRRAVDAAEPFAHFTEEDKALRRRLRARARLAGDATQPDGKHTIECVAEALAYEYWHRMLFARFLAENGLLMHPDGVAVSLADCEELAPTAEPPAPNGFALAARFASRMLPQIFRTDDVLLEIEFAPEYSVALERILDGLSAGIFRASESLGWSYQFWQGQRKDQINESGAKIDGSTIAPVTQLFTETYMVDFLLHNTIGAWWVGRHPRQKPPVEFTYLRLLDDDTPAAGTFPNWPKSLRDFTLLDPCCGSYHFLVSAFKLLVPLRMHEEGLSAAEAVDAVLRENLHGIDIDPNCAMMAAFSLAFVAWRYPDESGEMLGFRNLELNLACSGKKLYEKDRQEWLKLANGDAELRSQIDDLFTTFEPCYHVGSLIDPTRDCGPLFSTESAEITRKLTVKLAKHQHEVEFADLGVAAQGLFKAAELLSGKYTLVATNVPYLGRGKQGDEIKSYVERHYGLGKADLATAFVLRCLELCAAGGSTALVTPQSWLFLTSYKKMREKLLADRQWNLVARLGPRAFETIGGEVVNVALLALNAGTPANDHRVAGLDVADAKTPTDKANLLVHRVPTQVQQVAQLKNPDAVVDLIESKSTTLLSEFATAYRGQGTGDTNRFICCFWEIRFLDPESDWVRFSTTPDTSQNYDGNCLALLWENGEGDIKRFQDDLVASGQPMDGWKRGWPSWGKKSVRLRQMGDFSVCLSHGWKLDSNSAVIVPHLESNLPAIWAFCESGELSRAVRRVDQSLKVTSDSLTKVPFDLAHWQAVAAEKYPNGLPEPHSDDPTQWLFKGYIATSTDPLQVAVARLLGYRWPDQPKLDAVVDPHVDDDGIVCLPGVKTEPPAAERLADLLRAVGYKTDTDLAAWLRDSFFAEHCKRFHQRPFIWHIWDGRKDGFAALVNYHKLTHKALENLTYSYLGDWIAAQSKSEAVGADLRLAAAQALQTKLKLILAGEPPYDIFVRWKPLSEQAIGWHPDLNDGVRMNIRPFVAADILRKTPNIKWTKDRGKEPERAEDAYPWFWANGKFTGDRVNDIHLKAEEKTAARAKMAAKGDGP